MDGYLNPSFSTRALAWLFPVNSYVPLLLSCENSLIAFFLILSCLLSVMSAAFVHFDQFDMDSQEASSPFPTSSPSSTSVSTSTSLSASVYGFGAEMGIAPSATMLQPPVQHLSIPFVSARARIAEFERLREELWKTEMVREQQVERLHALADEASYELDVPQVWLTVSPTHPPTHTDTL